MKNYTWLILALVSIPLLVIFELLIWRPMLAPPDQRTYTDFIAFYAAGRIAQSQGYAQIYNIDLEKKVEQSAGAQWALDGNVLLYNHMPYLVPVLTLLVDNDYPASLLRWAFLLMAIYILATILLINEFFSNTDLVSRLILGLGVLTFFPLFLSLIKGQDTAWLFLGIGIWCIGILKKHDWLAAIGLALTTVRPHICIVLAFPLLFNQHKTLWRFVLVTGILAMTSFLLIGWMGTLDYLNLLKISAAGNWFGMKPDAMVNLYGIFVRTLGFLSPNVSLIIYIAGIIGIFILWQNWITSKEYLLGLVIVLALLTVPHLHSHDLTLLIFPLLFYLKHKINLPSFNIWILLPVGISFLFFAGFVFPGLEFVGPYIVMAALAWAMIEAKDLPLAHAQS